MAHQTGRENSKCRRFFGAAFRTSKVKVLLQEAIIAVTQDYIVGLDIGTTKICTVIAKADAESEILDIAGVGTVPARGVSKGTVVDLNQAAASIQESIQAASHMAGFRVKKALIGVTGAHIDACNLKGGVSISSDQDGDSATVTHRDIARAFESATIRVMPGREILHLVPRQFSLDGERGIESPLGMNASRLEAEIHLVTAAANSLKNVVECANRAGIEAQALVLEPIATSEAVSTADERKMGVAIIDIGGGTSDIAVFCDGALHTSAIVPVGGNHVTRDISIGMRTPFDIAERLKIESGAVASPLQKSDQKLEVLSAGNDGRVHMPRAMLGKIIAPRMTELFELARDAMHCNDIRKQLPAGVIITGGGALLPGAAELAQEVFGLPVHLGSPSGMIGWADRVNSPKFATAVGLLHYARRLQNDDYAFAELPGDNNSLRRVWGVPLEFDSASKHGSEDASEKVFFDAPTKLIKGEIIKSQSTSLSNIPELAKIWWRDFNKAIQPAVDRIRNWIGFDGE
ncbi:MAG: cell division protein FtsA [Abditibacteriaceae bacterium]